MHSVCLIDDDIEYANRFRSETARFFQFTHFKSSKETLANGDAMDAFDLIVIDIHLKDDSGFGLLDKIKPSLKHRPALFFLTEDLSLETKLLGLKMNVNDFLQKSMTFEEIILRLNNGTNLNKRNDRLSLGNLVLFLDSILCQIENPKQEIQLTKIEFQILFQILQSPHIYSKSDLEHILWKDSVTVSNTLNTHINKLNNKLNDWSYYIKIDRTGKVRAVLKSNDRF